jgi:hypothetical protein
VRQAKKPAGDPITREGNGEQPQTQSIAGGNLLILKFVRQHLVFVSLPAEPLLQIAVGAFASEAAACVGLFSKMRLVHRCAPFEAGADWLSVTGASHGPHGDSGKLKPECPVPNIKSEALGCTKLTSATDPSVLRDKWVRSAITDSVDFCPIETNHTKSVTASMTESKLRSRLILAVSHVREVQPHWRDNRPSTQAGFGNHGSTHHRAAQGDD